MNLLSFLKNCKSGLFLLSALLFIVGCRGGTSENPPVVGFPNMRNQDKCKTQGESLFFKDGRCNRPTVEGTIPVGASLMQQINPFYTGIVAGKTFSPDGMTRNNSQFIESIPTTLSMNSLHSGRQLFNTFCSPCHDRLGEGNGRVIQRSGGGLPKPPSLHHPELISAPAGYLFTVISNGKGAMKPYAGQISPEDRWKIVAYIRALQKSQNPTSQDLGVLP